jgi:hypothetical protein
MGGTKKRTPWEYVRAFSLTGTMAPKAARADGGVTAGARDQSLTSRAVGDAKTGVGNNAAERLV